MIFVQLDRTFSPYSKDEILVPPSLFGSARKQTTWKDILQLHRVVIVAEANSGKSEEFRQISMQLLADGKPSFFLPIEQLCDRQFDECLPPDSQKLFQTWRENGGSGYFFLDSID